MAWLTFAMLVLKVVLGLPDMIETVMGIIEALQGKGFIARTMLVKRANQELSHALYQKERFARHGAFVSLDGVEQKPGANLVSFLGELTA